MAILALIATYFVKRKSESKNEKTRKILLSYYLSFYSVVARRIIAIKKDKAESKGIRIVPTTVALTMTLDKLDLPIVGKPTSYKSYQIDIKCSKVGQPMEPSVEQLKSESYTCF